MSRRKLNGGGGDADGAAVSKKSKTSAEVDGIEVQWEWEGDAGKWTMYDQDDNSTITDAFNAGKKDAILDVGSGVKLQLVFAKAVQKNKKSGWERRIRCCVKNKGETGFFAWQWEDEHGQLNPYSVKVTFDLEKALDDGDQTVGIVAAGRQYTVDLQGLTQTNDDTDVIRNISRKPSGAGAATAQTPTVPKPAKISVKKEPAQTATTNSASSKKKPAAAASGKKAASGKRRASGRDADDSEEETKIKTVLLKGKAPVDPHCTAKVGVAHVFYEGKDVYDVMLNQTNVGNNNNKYFIIQLLQDDKKKVYSVWFHWGRVGYNGQSNLISCGPDLDEAKDLFCRKFSDKTKNEWSLRNSFSKVSGKYDLVKIDYNAQSTDETDSAKPAKSQKVPDSKLDERLQALIKLICDVKSMEDAMMEMKYDTRKAPLGKLTVAQIKAGYSALKKIDACVEKGDFGQKLVDACSDFYTRIPHDFGMQRPPIIRTKTVVKAKLELLEALGDIEIAMKIIKQSTSSENPIDSHYKHLSCDIEPMEKTDPTFKVLEQYLQNTHASTHNQYKMRILNIFEINKASEQAKFVDHGNRMLLWHGSRLSNYVGIFSQGLRIAPPEAPVTGYMFGKGIYFADMSSKSANYCFATRSKNVGLVLLCDVSLGQCNELLAADYKADEMPKGKHSVKGLGKIGPHPASTHKLPDGTLVPYGKSTNTGVNNPNGYTLNYNEFIVYDPRQVRMRYIMKIQFDF